MPTALVDIVLAVTALEAVVLMAIRWRTGTGIAIRPLVANLAAGVALLLAVRGALTGAGWPWLGACLAAAGIAHAADTALRWRQDRYSR